MHATDVLICVNNRSNLAQIVYISCRPSSVTQQSSWSRAQALWPRISRMSKVYLYLANPGLSDSNSCEIVHGSMPGSLLLIFNPIHDPNHASRIVSHPMVDSYPKSNNESHSNNFDKLPAFSSSHSALTVLPVLSLTRPTEYTDRTAIDHRPRSPRSCSCLHLLIMSLQLCTFTLSAIGDSHFFIFATSIGHLWWRISRILGSSG